MTAQKRSADKLTLSVPISRMQLSDEVGTYLRDLIMSGRLQRGEHIRVDSVAEELGISATPVREALMSLRAEGFVEQEPRKGFVVVPISADDVRDLFEVQATLAGELAARACDALDAAALERLRYHQRQLWVAHQVADLEQIEVENHRFHREINRSAGSPKLTWLLGILARYSPKHFYATIEGWPKASLEDHDDILAALERKDSEQARQAMRTHIIHAGDLLATHLVATGLARSPTEPDTT